MCFITTTLHNWVFLRQKILILSLNSAHLQTLKMPEFYLEYTPSVDKPITEQEIYGMCTLFRMKTRLE